MLPSIIVANVTDTDATLVPFTEIHWEPLAVVYMKALCTPPYHVICFRIPLLIVEAENLKY